MTREARRRFGRIASAGILFQGGSAAVDSSTVMAALVHLLGGSALAVGAVTAILRTGWLLPPLVVGYLAERRGRSMPYFVAGAFGRATWIGLLAAVLALAGRLPPAWLLGGVFLAWTAYAFTSGIVAVPYNDIVARSVPSEWRSRLLAIRFLGGGVAALAIAALASRLMSSLPFPASYAGLVILAAALMLASAALFVSAGEPPRPAAAPHPGGFAGYLRAGWATVREDRAFRHFLLAQWCGAGVMMAAPFYVVEALALELDAARVALLLGAQTAGALASNALWGWWGDRHGKRSLLRGVAILRAIPPLAALLLATAPPPPGGAVLNSFVAMFLVLGALANGNTIAVIGFLMEISPERRRPAYTGYFNALSAPPYLLPLAAGMLAEVLGIRIVFALAAAAAVAQYQLLRDARGVHGAARERRVR